MSSSSTRSFAPSAHSLRLSSAIRVMLDKLPTELALTIAELGAPQIAPDRKSLAIVRRRYFISLATVSRALYAALRPYIWEHVQIKGAKTDALVQMFTRDTRCAEFVKELACVNFSQPAFAKLWTMFPRFVKLTSLAICGRLDDSEPLQLCMLERLSGASDRFLSCMPDEAGSQLMLLRDAALKHLHLRNVLMSKRLPKTTCLELLCLDGRVRVHRPLGQDVPIMPDAIITRHSTALKKTLRLVDHDLQDWIEDGVDAQFCLDALSRVDSVDVDVASFANTALALSLRSSSAMPCFVLKARPHDVFALLQDGFPLWFPANLHVWITNPWLTLDCALVCFQRTMRALCSMTTSTPHLKLQLSLPTGFGRTVAQRDLTAKRLSVYEVLKELRRCSIPISFYDEPRADDSLPDSTHVKLEWLGLEDKEGYFTELLEGRCSDPELRDFKVVMVD